MLVTRKRNCYDCKHCKYDIYGVTGVCDTDYPDPPVFEDLGAKYHEWEEPAGSFPMTCWRNCPHFEYGKVQRLKKQILRHMEKVYDLHSEINYIEDVY